MSVVAQMWLCPCHSTESPEDAGRYLTCVCVYFPAAGLPHASALSECVFQVELSISQMRCASCSHIPRHWGRLCSEQVLHRTDCSAVSGALSIPRELCGSLPPRSVDRQACLGGWREKHILGHGVRDCDLEEPDLELCLPICYADKFTQQINRSEARVHFASLGHNISLSFKGRPWKICLAEWKWEH